MTLSTNRVFKLRSSDTTTSHFILFMPTRVHTFRSLCTVRVGRVRPGRGRCTMGEGGMGSTRVWKEIESHIDLSLLISRLYPREHYAECETHNTATHVQLMLERMPWQHVKVQQAKLWPASHSFPVKSRSGTRPKANFDTSKHKYTCYLADIATAAEQEKKRSNCSQCQNYQNHFRIGILPLNLQDWACPHSDIPKRVYVRFPYQNWHQVHAYLAWLIFPCWSDYIR